jgi:hypothetical protein
VLLDGMVLLSVEVVRLEEGRMVAACWLAAPAERDGRRSMLYVKERGQVGAFCVLYCK